jgi:hypothetical protein
VVSTVPAVTVRVVHSIMMMAPDRALVVVVVQLVLLQPRQLARSREARDPTQVSTQVSTQPRPVVKCTGMETGGDPAARCCSPALSSLHLVFFAL